MSLLMDREFILRIDAARGVSVVPTDGGTVVITVEDPIGVAVVEISQAQLDGLIDGLEANRV
jgi:hypothetical protein